MLAGSVAAVPFLLALSVFFSSTIVVDAWACRTSGSGSWDALSKQRRSCRSDIHNTYQLAPVSRVRATARAPRCSRSPLAVSLHGVPGENDEDTKPVADDEQDDDGVPLQLESLKPQERATLFGLEPNTELDPLDNGLTFTGPIILFFSTYVTLSLLFGELPDALISN